jgi:hypothetical protein
MSATISGGGVASVQFPYDNLKTPLTYVVKIGDLILDKEGYLYQIDALNTTYCEATYCGTQVVAFGKSAYVLAVEHGFKGSEEEWLASIKGDQGIQGIQGDSPYIGSNGNWWVGYTDTGVNVLKIATGNYTGDGNESKTLTFDFTPFLVVVKADAYVNGVTNMLPNILMRSQSRSMETTLALNGNTFCPWPVDGFMSWGDNSVTCSDYSNGASINENAVQYSYFALGYSGGTPDDAVTQRKTVTPSTTQQTVVPDDGYDALNSVVVEPISYIESNNPAGGTTVTIG